MHCTRAIHLFRRLTFGDTRLHITYRPNVIFLVFYSSNNKYKEFGIVRNYFSNNLVLRHPVVQVLDAIKLKRTMSSKSPVIDSKSKRTTNRLSLEKSPYLLQHAHNPVDWYPWGSEAFDKARSENKLIFLSVGYSTCHWCHVMEKESFENPEVAAIMNEYFVNVKVDREERPDIDKIYMTFIQATTGGGGWPMSVFLTPDLNPVTGGTYFPPEDKWGRPGFKSILKNLGEQWRHNSADLMETGSKVLEVLTRATKLESADNSDLRIPSPQCFDRCVQQFIRNHDSENGGFGPAPKFPQPVNLNFLFHAYARDPNSEEGRTCLEMALRTLDKMADGGIHDHVCGGFARYSVDDRWHVPHFEKMLYDQAQLIVSYCQAYVATGNQKYARVAKSTLQYCSRDLGHPEGGFYAAEDADSLPDHNSDRKQEGAFCVWEKNEISDLLKNRKHANGVLYFDVFCHHFDVRETGNVAPAQDPHGELMDKNVLIVNGSVETTAEKFDMSIEDTEKILSSCLSVLRAKRLLRPRPSLDAKMVCSWNALMISACAKAYEALSGMADTDDQFEGRNKKVEQEAEGYLQKAVLCAEFVKKYLYVRAGADGSRGGLLRACYTTRNADGTIEQLANPIGGFLDDYAFMVRALLDLYEATLNRSWLRWARELQAIQDELFWDEDGSEQQNRSGTGGGYFTSALGDPTVVMRLKEDQDGAEPSGNSISAHNLSRLAAHSGASHEQLSAASPPSSPQQRHRSNSGSSGKRVTIGEPEAIKARKILAAFSHRLERAPVALPEMASALALAHDSHTQILIAGKREDPRTIALLKVVRSKLIPGRVLALADPASDSESGCSSAAPEECPLTSRIKPINGKSAAYVCRGRRCALPVTEPEDLAKLLDESDHDQDHLQRRHQERAGSHGRTD